MSKITRTPIQTLAALTLTLAACGSTTPGTGGDTGTGGGTGGGTTQATKFGIVSLSETSMGTTTFIGSSALFFGLNEPLPTGTSDPYSTLEGTCVVSDGTIADPGKDLTGDPTTLDAGQQLAVKANTADYTTLTRTTTDGIISYASPFPGPTSLPGDSLSVNIPGATGGIPAFGTLSFPTAPAFSLTAPAGGAVTTSTVFEWSGVSDGVVMLTGSDDAGNVYFACYAPDTGSFQFPAATKTDLAAKGFTGGSLDLAARMVFKANQKDDALVFTSVSRGQVFVDGTELAE